MRFIVVKTDEGVYTVEPTAKEGYGTFPSLEEALIAKEQAEGAGSYDTHSETPEAVSSRAAKARAKLGTVMRTRGKPK